MAHKNKKTNPVGFYCPNLSVFAFRVHTIGQMMQGCFRCHRTIICFLKMDIVQIFNSFTCLCATKRHDDDDRLEVFVLSLVFREAALPNAQCDCPTRNFNHFFQNCFISKSTLITFAQWKLPGPLQKRALRTRRGRLVSMFCL